MSSKVGVLMLDTRFPRLLGDVGNPATFGGKALYHVVPTATVETIVSSDTDKARALLPDFITGARKLEAAGAEVITTSCGFLTMVQKELSAAVSVPVVTSSLLAVPMLMRMTGKRPVGVITADRSALTHRHLSAAGIADLSRVQVVGMETSEAFRAAILQNGTELDDAAIVQDLLARATALGVGAVVLECTNLQPYAKQVRAACSGPVLGLIDVVHMLSPWTEFD